MSQEQLELALLGEPLAGGLPSGGILRVRFHGRGGHGVKTAGRVLGTAAFLAGFEAQDAPIYGAERRGAAVASFVRISNRRIMERGPIARPDLIVLADETLLHDGSAGVLQGQDAASAMFVNASSSDTLRKEFGLQPEVQAYDVSARAKEVFGRASVLSAALAAAAARLTGVVDEPTLLAALDEEFTELGLTPSDIAKNRELAADVFRALRPAAWRTPRADGGGSVEHVPAVSVRTSAPSILHPGNATARLTGAWRVDRPVIDEAACTRCGLCAAMCPDGVIRMDERGFPQIDYDHCKGCMICRQLCPLEAIDRKQETRAW